MNALLILLVAAVILVIGYVCYGGWLAKQWGVDPKRPTPAHELEDHFFPQALSSQVPGVNWDGVWNLVLACPDCNRGEGGKFARIPATEYLRRLNRRNEYLIGSHHPLRETLIAQTGETPQARWEYLKKVDKIATDLLPGERWKTEEREAPAF